MPANVRVKYHGPVDPAFISDALGMCHVYIQPSKSENFGHSLFEALTAGRPVITSHNTPWNQLKEKNAGINVVPDNISEIQKGIDYFAGMDHDELEDWSIRYRSYALMAMDIERIKKQYITMFNANPISR